MIDADAVPRGKIVSFYSFKGGVGRTMAVANVAFLCAMNGLDVLVMDWDLEAPGLHHYFRGLIEPGEMVDLPSARGVLDLAWEWRNGIDAVASAEELDRHFDLFRSGKPFQDVVRTVLRNDDPSRNTLRDDIGRLDIILAGSNSVATPSAIEYERALAAFSWSEFLERYAGGGMIAALRGWATSKYDLVLVDSRTGLADVAGICTMQLPDAVALTFVLNRQNIEGVARVASAIRHNRKDSIKIWSVPMRVSREGTSEEADAMARALRELTRPGRLERAATERDLKGLLIKAEPNVPFMESLSAFNDTSAALDPLTANMARLASEITGRPITVPYIKEQWRDVVSSRLAPTLSTDAYLRQLLLGEPERAAREVHGYVESAISTLAEGDQIPEEYVAALVETSFVLQQRGDGESDVYDTPNRVTLLLRRLYERNPTRWRALLAQAVENSLDSDVYYLPPEDEVVALDEIDDLLAAEKQTVGLLERRSSIRMRAARIFETLADHVQHLAAVDDALVYLDAAEAINNGPGAGLRVARLEALLQKASALEALEQSDEALAALRKVLKLLPEIDGPDMRSEGARLGFDVNFRIMRLLHRRDPANRDAMRHAIAAIERAQPSSPIFLGRIAEIADVVTGGAPQAQSVATLLLRRFFASPAPVPLQFFGRAPTGATRLIGALARLLGCAGGERPEREASSFVLQAVELVSGLVATNEERLMSMMHRPSKSRSPVRFAPALIAAVEDFLEVAERADGGPSIEEALIELRSRADRLKRNTPANAPTTRRRKADR